MRSSRTHDIDTQKLSPMADFDKSLSHASKRFEPFPVNSSRVFVPHSIPRISERDYYHPHPPFSLRLAGLFVSDKADPKGPLTCPD